MNVPMNRPMTVTPTQTAPTVQVHTTASASLGTQVMDEIAQVLNMAKSLNYSQLVCNITHLFLFIYYQILMNVPMNRPMSVTTMQTAPTVQVHTTVSATVGTQVMDEIA